MDWLFFPSRFPVCLGGHILPGELSGLHSQGHRAEQREETKWREEEEEPCKSSKDARKRSALSADYEDSDRIGSRRLSLHSFFCWSRHWKPECRVTGQHHNPTAGRFPYWPNLTSAQQHTSSTNSLITPGARFPSPASLSHSVPGLRLTRLQQRGLGSRLRTRDALLAERAKLRRKRRKDVTN